ncbi:hypothetical protein EVAR_28137_1 [Eumeta japonica]|uniref:Uncharacterized protein n=1 Tax=Eumeta variegata TaxID=151549 RepID=A0A4C1VDB4_EUMVA|nr:hypothetical protein EVAR_28137_1 [Eumeta japonica]
MADVKMTDGRDVRSPGRVASRAKTIYLHRRCIQERSKYEAEHRIDREEMLLLCLVTLRDSLLSYKGIICSRDPLLKKAFTISSIALLKGNTQIWALGGEFGRIRHQALGRSLLAKKCCFSGIVIGTVEERRSVNMTPTIGDEGNIMMVPIGNMK